MIRSFTAIFVLLLAGPVFAQDWSRQVEAYENALRSHKQEAWHHALTSFGWHDHPGALRYLALFYAEQKSYEGEWKPGRRPHHGQFLRRDPDLLYGRLLAKKRRARSLRYMVDRLADEDPAVADLFAKALSKQPGLHVADKVLRAGFRKALRARDEKLALRYLSVLGSRLHVLDREFVREQVMSGSAPILPRMRLLAAYPDHDLWRQMQNLNARKGFLPAKDLERIVGALDLPAVIEGATRIEALLGTLPDRNDPLVLKESVAALKLPHPGESLHLVHIRRARAALNSKPFAALSRLHEYALRLKFSRAWRGDEYFYGKRQRQKWDKTQETRRLIERELTVDFGAPEPALAIDDCRLIRPLLGHLLGEGPVLGPPWHPDLFDLNRRKVRDLESIAFTPEELARNDLRDEVLAANRHHPMPSDLERRNVDLVNAYRAEYGLLPVRIDGDLTKSARNHSYFMAKTQTMAHEFPGNQEPYGKTPVHRMINAGYPAKYAGGENVLFGTQNPLEAFDWWRGSAGHRANMLGRGWTEVGVGEVAGYWTQNFGSEPFDEDHDARPQPK